MEVLGGTVVMEDLEERRELEAKADLLKCLGAEAVETKE
jgi:hypothetical protein